MDDRKKNDWEQVITGTGQKNMVIEIEDRWPFVTGNKGIRVGF